MSTNIIINRKKLVEFCSILSLAHPGDFHPDERDVWLELHEEKENFAAEPKRPTPAEMIMLMQGWMNFFGFVLSSDGWEEINWWASYSLEGIR